MHRIPARPRLVRRLVAATVLATFATTGTAFADGPAEPEVSEEITVYGDALEDEELDVLTLQVDGPVLDRPWDLPPAIPPGGAPTPSPGADDTDPCRPLLRLLYELARERSENALEMAWRLHWNLRPALDGRLELLTPDDPAYDVLEQRRLERLTDDELIDELHEIADGLGCFD